MEPKRTILITGATSGIGRHAALFLASKGHRVIATGRAAPALSRLKVEAGQLPLEMLSLDVTDRASLAAAAEAVERLTSSRGVDAVINNAGYGEAAPMLEVREDEVRAMYETNVFGLLAVTQAFLPAMVARGAGRLINISSVGGRFTLPLFGAYNSTKYAVEALSDAMRLELQPLGIKVVIIEPATTKTEFAKTSVRKMASYRRSGSPYAAVYARADELAAQAERSAADPIVISRVIERACTTPSPRARYVAPLSGWLMVSLARWLPTTVLDWLLRRMTGLTRSSLKLGAALPQSR